MTYYPIIVIGSGVAGMTAAIRLADQGTKTCLVSNQPLQCIDALLDPHGVNVSQISSDSFETHFKDTVVHGGYLANQSLVHQMCEKAEGIQNLFERMGVVFNKTQEGLLQNTKQPGSSFSRTLSAQPCLGRQTTTALTEQISYFKNQNLIDQQERCEFLSLVIDEDQVCRGVVLQDLRSMKVFSLRTDAVIFATGSAGALYGEHSMQSLNSKGSAVSRLYKQGVHLANPEFVAFSSSSSSDTPSMSDWLGGLWIDDNHMTNIPGVFAAGKCAYQYHGAAVLPGNMILSGFFGGVKAADHAIKYSKEVLPSSEDAQESLFEEEVSRQNKVNLEYADFSGPENATALHQEFAAVMYEHLGPIRNNASIKLVFEKLSELKHRFQRISLTDNSSCFNQEIMFLRDLNHMFDLALTIAIGSLARDESRGVHCKSDFPLRDDARFLRTTKIIYNKEKPEIYYEDVDVSLMKPEENIKREFKVAG